MNKFLSDQIEKTLGGKFPLPDKFQALLKLVSDTYDQFEANRKNLELRLSEKQEQTSESKYRSLFEEMADGVYKSTNEGKFVDVNPALVKMLGYDSKEELLSIDIKTKLYFEASERDSAVQQDNTNGLAVFRLRKKDGSEIWFEERGSYVSDGNGSTIYHEGILRDVTKRIHTEFELMRSQQETADYKKALNQSLIVSIKDKNGVFTFANSNFCNISKFTVEELVGKDQSIINSENHTKDFVDAIDTTISSGKVWRGEEKHKTKDGNFYWVDSAIVPFLDESGKPYQFLTISIDVTERKLADEALLANELKFRSMIEHNEDVISMFDAQGNFTYVSPAITKEFDFTFEECLMLNAIQIIHPEDQPMMKNFLLEVMQIQSIPFKCPVFRIMKKDGSHVWVEGTLTNLLQNDGVKAIVANFKDITKRREYEEQLKTRNSELLKSNMELDKFVYSVSHDLRAPLSSMLGVIGISEEDTKEPETKEHLAMLKASIKKLDLSISDILDYSRNSRLEVNKENIDLRQMLDKITDNLKYKNRNQVEIKVELNDNAQFVSDKNRVNIILNNLISNAITYQDPKNSDPLVNVKVDMTDTETNIVVKDNGIGISKELQEKIFEMFFRGSESSDGSGLGLYIVKESVEKLKGKIAVKSIPGKGSEFSILIPNN
ncbi:MAG: PAS domain-containing sensor histidine kinase [Bacteroidetes bacterium]|nr:PAS domain-containing sensor histidine kinase [Bacteroidota bacterium]